MVTYKSPPISFAASIVPDTISPTLFSMAIVKLPAPEIVAFTISVVVSTTAWANSPVPLRAPMTAFLVTLVTTDSVLSPISNLHGQLLVSKNSRLKTMLPMPGFLCF